MEKEGEGREQRICGLIETELLQIRVHTTNPKTKAILRRKLQRKSRDLHCQWEFAVEHKPSGASLGLSNGGGFEG